MNELERRGLRVGVPEPFGAIMTKQRVLDTKQATARIHLATGAWLPVWRRTRGAIEIAFSDPRSEEARAEYARLRKQVIATFRKRGRADLVHAIDWDLPAAGAGADDLVLGLAIDRMFQIGAPAAVFIVPVGAP